MGAGLKRFAFGGRNGLGVKALSLILSASMVISSMPVSAIAQQLDGDEASLDQLELVDVGEPEVVETEPIETEPAEPEELLSEDEELQETPVNMTSDEQDVVEEVDDPLAEDGASDEGASTPAEDESLELVQEEDGDEPTAALDETSELDGLVSKLWEDIEAELPENADLTETVEGVFRAVVLRAGSISLLDHDQESDEEAALAFLKGDGASSLGVASVMKRVLILAEIKSTVVEWTGSEEDTTHRWNLVEIDDAWYHVDAFAAAKDYVENDPEELGREWLLISDDAVRTNDEERQSWSLVKDELDLTELPEANTTYVFPSDTVDTEPVIQEFEIDVNDIIMLDEEEFEKLVEEGEPQPEEADEEPADVPAIEEQPAEGDQLMSWIEFLQKAIAEEGEPDKDRYTQLVDEYAAYRAAWKQNHGEEAPEGASSGDVYNDYLDVNVESNGHFTIGTREGNPNYSTDNYQKLLYGYAGSSTSETLIVVDDDYEEYFVADSVSVTQSRSVAYMDIPEKDITVVQTISLIKSGKVSYDDVARIEYKVINGSDENDHTVGVRIMIDTMIASNDYAPFKVSGTGNVTACRTFYGSEIPESYQVYDSLDKPTTLGAGYLRQSGDRVPDVVHFCNWPDMRGSSWSFAPSDGSTLGDSAVAVKFDRTSLAAGRIMTVATCYGVAGGGSASSSTCTIPEDAICVKVKDGETDSALSDVTVSVTRQDASLFHVTEETDIDGLAVFDGFTGTPETVSITLSKEGYKTQAYTKLVKKGQILTLRIVSGDTPLVTGAFLGSTDLLDDTVHFVENHHNKIEHAKKSDLSEARIVVTSDTDNCVFYLMEDERVIEKNETGIFTLKTLDSKSSGTIIEKLHSQGYRYVKCVSPSGKSSQKLRLGITVSVPSVSVSGAIPPLFLKDLIPGGSSSLTEGTIAALFLGSEFEFGPVGEFSKSKLNFIVEYTDDETVRVGLNLKSLPTEKDKKFKELCEEAAGFSEYSEKEKSNIIKKMLGGKFENYENTRQRIWLGEAKCDFSLFGYGEGQIEDGGLRVDLAVVAKGYGTQAYTQNFFFVVPLYLQIGGEAGLEGAFKMNLVNSEGIHMPRVYSGTIKPIAGLWIEGGVGTSGVASIGAQGKATIDFTWDLVAKSAVCYLTGKANLVLNWIFWEQKLNLAEGKLKLYDSNDREGTVYGGDENIWEALENEPLRLRQRTYLSAEESRDGSEDNDDFVITNAYEYSSPMVVSANGTQYKFWLWDDPDKQISNGSTLMFSKYQDGYWSDEQPVYDDGTSDFFFDVKSAGDKLYVVWHNSNQVFDDATVTPDETAAAAEIYLAVIDGANDNSVSVTRVTNNAEMDSMPAVTLVGNTAYVAWYHTANGPLQNDLPVYLAYAPVTNGAVGTISSVDCEGMNVAAISADTIGQSPIATYALSDPNNYVSASRELRTLDLSNGDMATLEEAERGAIVHGMLEGSPMLFWSEGGNIRYASSLDSEASLVFPEEWEDGAPNDFVVVSHAGSTYLVWAGAEDSETNYKSAYATKYQSGSWSLPFKLTELGYGTINSLSAYDDTEGNLVLSYMAIEYDDDGNLLSSEMCERTVNDSQALEFIVEFDESEAIPGETLPLSILVANLGNKTVNELDVNIYRDEAVYERHLDGLEIAPGEVQTVELDDFVLEDLEPLSSYDSPYGYYIELTAPDGSAASDTFEVGFVNLAISQESPVIIDNVEYLPVVIDNASGFAASNVHLRVLADSTDGALVLDEVFESISGNGSVVTYVDMDSIEQTKRLYAYATTDSLVHEDESYADDGEPNFYELFVSNESAVVTEPVEVTVVATQGGMATDVSGIHESYETIELEATPLEGYVFDHWDADVATAFGDADSPTTTMLVPEEPVTVTAVFVSDAELAFELSDTTLDLYGNDSSVIGVSFTGGVDGKIEWESSDTSVATVSSRGVVEAVAPGTAVITARCGQNEATCQVTVHEIAASSIRIVPATAKLVGIGETMKLDVVSDPIDVTESLIWSSADEGVATVDQDGTVTSHDAGVTTITVTSSTDATISSTCNLTVMTAPTALALTHGELTFDLSDDSDHTTILRAVYTPTNAVVSRDLVWSVIGDDVLDIEASGEHGEQLLVKAKDGVVGEATIIAETENGLVARCRVKVIASPTGINVNVESTENNPLVLYKRCYRHLSVYLEPSYASGSVSWSSSDEGVVSVNSSGQLYGVAPGNAVVTARCGSVETLVYVSVRVPTGIVANTQTTQAAPLELPECTSTSLSVTLQPSGAEGPITWQSSNTNIATVDSDGYVTAVKKGTAVITASCEGFAAKFYVRVTRDEVILPSSTKTFESDHSYTSNLNRYWVLKKPGASAIKVTFSQESATENNYDKIYVMDGNEKVIGTFTGPSVGGATLTVAGDTLIVRLTTDGSVEDYGFKASVATGYNLSSASTKVTLSATSYTYDGKAKTPTPTVTVSGVKLVKGTDYTVTYSNNTNASNSAKVTIKGRGLSSGQVVKTFKIAKATNAITVKKTSYSVTTSTAKAQAITLGATAKGGTLKYTSSNNKIKVSAAGKVTIPKSFVGKAVITISASASTNYMATPSSAYKKVTITVKPAKTALSSATLTASKKVTVTWKKNVTATGYQVQYSTSKTFASSNKTVTITNATTTSRAITGLTKGKTYYVRIRTYRTVGGVKYYSDWSAAKSVKITK